MKYSSNEKHKYQTHVANSQIKRPPVHENECYASQKANAVPNNSISFISSFQRTDQPWRIDSAQKRNDTIVLHYKIRHEHATTGIAISMEHHGSTGADTARSSRTIESE